MLGGRGRGVVVLVVGMGVVAVGVWAVVGGVGVGQGRAGLGVCEVGGGRVVVAVVVAVRVVKGRRDWRYRLQRLGGGGMLRGRWARGCVIVGREGRVVVVGGHDGRQVRRTQHGWRGGCRCGPELADEAATVTRELQECAGLKEKGGAGRAVGRVCSEFVSGVGLRTAAGYSAGYGGCQAAKKLG